MFPQTKSLRSCRIKEEKIGRKVFSSSGMYGVVQGNNNSSCRLLTKPTGSLTMLERGL